MNNMKKIITILTLASGLLIANLVFAVSYQELPTVIKVDGILHQNGDMVCAAQVIEHSTVNEFVDFETNYTLKLLDSENNVISNYSFPVELNKDAESNLFYFNAPYDQNVKAIIIEDPQGQEKCRVNRSANNPEIKITYPQKGGWDTVEKIEWEMSDKDSDDWLLVDVYVAGNEDFGWALIGNQAEQSPFSMGEPIEATRVRLVVSDGFNSTEVILESNKAKGSVFGELDFLIKRTVTQADEKDHLKANDLNYEPKFSKEKPTGNGSDLKNLTWLWWFIVTIILIAVIWLIRKTDKKLKIILTIVLIIVSIGSYYFYQRPDGVSLKPIKIQDKKQQQSTVPDKPTQPKDTEKKDIDTSQKPPPTANVNLSTNTNVNTDISAKELTQLYQKYIDTYNRYTDLVSKGLGGTPKGKQAEQDYRKAKEDYERAQQGQSKRTGQPATPPVEIASIDASSTLPPEEGFVYNPYMTIDGSNLTSWVEGKSDDGISEWLKFNFSQIYLIKKIKIFPGYASKEDIYFKNNRVRKIRLEFSNGNSQEFELVDEFRMQTVSLSTEIPTEYIKITILSVWPGSKFSDTSIAEVKFE